ncbi:MAG: hypothetical protein ABIP62_08220 [Vicinamibacteria bacterium]
MMKARPRLFGILFLLAVLDIASWSIAADRGALLYRMTLMRAAPGRQADLVKAVGASAAASPGKRPLVLKHSQGDQWDLLVLTPIAAAGRLSLEPMEPGVSADLITWQEDEIVRGPDLAMIDGFLSAGLYHVEMFHALAGKRDPLLREREMENAYLKTVGRPANAIFTREWGASWDSFTIGAYRNWKHYAERDDIAKNKALAAAKAAGFESDDAIGPYLRSLILDHHDTLTTPVR